MIGLIIFELFVVLFTIGLFIYMKINKYHNVIRKFIILFISVLLFEFMTEPLWNNVGFQNWAYIYLDISWIITLGWVSIFMFTFLIVDNAFRVSSEKKRFWVYLLFIETIVVPVESFLIIFGIRNYPPILKNSLTGFMIPFTLVPIEAIYGIPLFVSLIICFYKYTNYLFDSK